MKKAISKFAFIKKFIYIFIPIIIGLVLAAVLFGVLKAGKISIVDSTVSSPLLAVYPANDGILQDVFVKIGQKINKGDPLAVVGSQTIYSPTGGIVTDINNSIGGDTVTTDPVAEIINPGLTRIDGVIDENKGLSEINIGDPVSFTVDALPGKVFWGYVDEVAQTAKPTEVAFTISSERPTQQFDVYAKFDAFANLEIKNGMSAKMTVYVN